MVKILLGALQPSYGTIKRAGFNAFYIDQDYSVIDEVLTVYEQAQQFNTGALQEHEIRTRLNRFLFSADDLDKLCIALSGGEKMRLILCALTIGYQAPDLIVLDEPTNNLDVQNIEILTTAVNGYQGTLVVISHDQRFLSEINIMQDITV